MIGTLPRQGADRSPDDGRIFVAGQRKKLTGAAGGEQGGCAIRCQPFQTLDIGLRPEVTLRIEIGERERQKAGADDGLEIVWMHGRSGFRLPG